MRGRKAADCVYTPLSTPDIPYFALRAALRAFKIAPGDFVIHFCVVLTAMDGGNAVGLPGAILAACAR